METATVLLVEDCMVQRYANERILLKAGYSVLHASDGEEALRTATAATPDLILMDLLLPGLSGRRVMLALKKDPVTAEIPVVILSALPKSNEQKLKREGAAAYFEKSRLVGDREGEKEMLKLIESIIVESRQKRQQSEVQLKAKAKSSAV